MEPPCATCKPQLLAENLPAVSIYQRCRGSWTTDSGYLVGIPTPAIETAMNWLKIDDDEKLIIADQVQLIADIIKNEVNEELEEKRNAETSS